jgi:hypothetical protein
MNSGVLGLTVLAAGSCASAVASAEEPPTVHLTADADRPNAVLERRVNVSTQWQTALGVPVYTWGETWEQACVTPCSVSVDPHSTYRVSGEVAPSSRFLLPQGQDEVKVHIRTSSDFAHSAGVALTTLGLSALVGGAIVVFVAPKLTDAVSETDTRVIGLALLGGGLVMLAVGLPLWLLSSSEVVTDDGRRLAKDGARPRLTARGLAF